MRKKPQTFGFLLGIVSNKNLPICFFKLVFPLSFKISKTCSLTAVITNGGASSADVIQDFSHVSGDVIFMYQLVNEIQSVDSFFRVK